MGMDYENRVTGGVNGFALNFGTSEQEIIVIVPYDFYQKVKPLVKREEPDKFLFQEFYELAALLENAIKFCPNHFSNEIIRNILTTHIQYKNHAIEKDMIHHVEVSDEFKRAMKIVFKRVDIYAFKDKKLIALLKSL
jgi:predicted GTPase